jgi:hypothetical protein
MPAKQSSERLNASLYSPAPVIWPTYLILNGLYPNLGKILGSTCTLTVGNSTWFECKYHMTSRDVSQVHCIKLNSDFGVLVCFVLVIEITTTNKQTCLKSKWKIMHFVQSVM